MKMRNLKPLSRPVFLSLWHVKRLLSKRTALKADVTGPENRPVCSRVLASSQPGIIPCWGSEGVNDGGRGRGMEVGGEGDYIPIATLSPPE